MLNHHYDGLEGAWAEYAEVAQKFVRARWHSIPPDDAEDLVQRIILAMHQVALKLGRGPGGWLWSVAQHELWHYWHERAHQACVTSLNKEQDSNGQGPARELWETVAAPEPDLDAQIDARTWLQGCSEKITRVARKVVSGEPLTEAERGYMAWWRKRVGIDSPRSGHVMTSSARAYEVQSPPLKVTLYQAIYAILARSSAPLHEKEITRLVTEAYPLLAQRIKRKFNRQIHVTLSKRQKSGVFVRVGPATWTVAGKSRAHVM